MQFPFAYQRNNRHVYVLLLLGAIGIVLFGLSMEFVALLMKGPIAERTNFLVGAIASAIFGLAFLAFGIWYYRRKKLFYESREWYGVNITGEDLEYSHFNSFKTDKWKLGLDMIKGIKRTDHKGRQLLLLDCKDKQRTIPAWLLSNEDCEELISILQNSKLAV